MIGPEGAGNVVAAWLTARVPARLRIIETRLELDEGTLADPAAIAAHESGPIGLEDWPAIYVLPQRLVSMTLAEVLTSSSEVYVCRYSVRVLAWVRADDYETTDALRKKYVLAIREALLERKQLKAAAAYGVAYVPAPGEPMIDPSSIREDYSEVIVDAGRTIAGAFTDLELVLTETLDGPAQLGQADTVDIRESGDTAGIQPHPGL